MSLPARRRLLRLALSLLVAGLTACDTADQLFPPNGSLRLQIQDGGLAFSEADPPGFQISAWQVEEAWVELDVDGDGTDDQFDFLGLAPCFFGDNIRFRDDLAATCRGTGLILPAGIEMPVTLHVRISAIEVRRSVEPAVPPEGDNDGDGLLNRLDNCPLIPNPDQEDTTGNGIGDACSLESPVTGALDILDSDADGWPDGLDNCGRVPNADQTDRRSNPDLIGDACELFVPVLLPDGELTLTYSARITPQESRITYLVVDLNSRTALVCGEGSSPCKLSPPGIVFSVVGG